MLIICLRGILHMVKVQCAICEEELRHDIAVMDAKWEEVCTPHLPDKVKYICRTCTKRIAIKVFEEY